MTTTQTVLAIVGLLLGLVVLGVVISLLNDVLAPLRRISADVKNADTAPMLTKGIPGADQLGTTRRLADSVPPLAIAYLNKLSLPVRPAPAPLSASAPAAAAAPPKPASAGPASSIWMRRRRCPPGRCSANERASDGPCAVRQPIRVGVHARGRIRRAARRHRAARNLRRTVLKLNDDIWDTWVNGKAVVKNTAMTYLLKNTRNSGDELVQELDNHR